MADSPSASLSPSASPSGTRPEEPLIVTEADLEKIRPDILNYGVTDWEDQIFRAETHVFRILEARWYRENAGDFGLNPNSFPFDPELLKDPDQIRLLISYKVLENIYLYLMKDSPQADPFERQSETFRKLFKDELATVLASGIDYEWGVGNESDERAIPRRRRLERG